MRLQSDLGREVEQGEIATACGVTRGAVSQWETGKSVPGDIDTYVKLARYLKVTLDWLIAGDGPMRLSDQQSREDAPGTAKPRPALDATVPPAHRPTAADRKPRRRKSG